MSLEPARAMRNIKAVRKVIEVVAIGLKFNPFGLTRGFGGAVVRALAFHL